jgi:hypothetical protein
MKGVTAGIGAAFAAILFMAWQEANRSRVPTSTPVKVERLEAGAAPNGSSGAGGLTPADAAGPTSGCLPAGGVDALGNPSYTYSDDAHIDTDGGTLYADPTQQSNTSSGNNSDTYPGVVLTKQMQANGLKQGDYARITNNQTGQTIVARVYDANFDDAKGIDHGDQAEVSDFAAAQLGIQLTANANTVGTNPITIRGYAGTSALPEDCNQSNQPTQTAQTDS